MPGVLAPSPRSGRRSSLVWLLGGLAVSAAVGIAVAGGIDDGKDTGGRPITAITPADSVGGTAPDPLSAPTTAAASAESPPAT